MPYIPIPDPCFNTPTPPPLSIPHPTPPPPPPLSAGIYATDSDISCTCQMSIFLLSWYVIDCHESFWHLSSHYWFFRIVPMSKLLNTSHRASVRLFMWHVYFWLSFSLFHWYSNCPLHHTSCLTLDIFMTRPTKLEGHYVFALSVRPPSVRKVKKIWSKNTF